MAKEEAAVEQVEEVVVSKLKVTFVMEVPGFLEKQQDNTAFLRNELELSVEKLEGSVLSVDIESIH